MDLSMRRLAYLSEKAAGAVRAVSMAGCSLNRHGLWGLFKRIAHWHRYRFAQPRIDAEFGTETLSMVAIEDFSASGPSVSYAYEYHPTPVDDFEAILKWLPINYSNFCFVDLGCGKGLALILAARFHFKRVIGVEFGRYLHGIALANLDKFRRVNMGAPPIDVILEDAAEFRFPKEPLVVYLYNPFGPEIVSKVLVNLQTSLSQHPRMCWVVYLEPLHHEILSGCDFLRTQKVSASGDPGVPYAVYTSPTGK
jgi:SAM-dependent methyltransferase